MHSYDKCRTNFKPTINTPCLVLAGELWGFIEGILQKIGFVKWNPWRRLCRLKHIQLNAARLVSDLIDDALLLPVDPVGNIYVQNLIIRNLTPWWLPLSGNIAPYWGSFWHGREINILINYSVCCEMSVLFNYPDQENLQSFWHQCNIWTIWSLSNEKIEIEHQRIYWVQIEHQTVYCTKYG